MTSRRLARTVLAAALSAAALVGTGCGNKHDEVSEAETEGIWVDVGQLDYHIQGSRLLEEGLVPDESYLKGLPAGEEPTADEVLFTVFVRIENKTDGPAPTAEDFQIVDTEENEFEPIAIDTEANPFAYVPTELQPGEVVPVPDSAQEFNSFAGAQLLFKLPLESYANRPLTLRIHSADGVQPVEAEINLDV